MYWNCYAIVRAVTNLKLDDWNSSLQASSNSMLLFDPRLLIQLVVILLISIYWKRRQNLIYEKSRGTVASSQQPYKHNISRAAWYKAVGITQLHWALALWLQISIFRLSNTNLVISFSVVIQRKLSMATRDIRPFMQ